MKRSFLILIMFCVLLSCHRHASQEEQFFSVFSPDTLLTEEDIYEMGVDREKGIDMNIYVFQKEDTTVLVEYEGADGKGKLMNYRWVIPIMDSSDEISFIGNLEKKYGVILLDTMDKTISNPQNGLVFKYYIGKIDTSLTYRPVRSDYCCIISYYPHWYAEYVIDKQ
ncbi:MAG: hypothetical protein J6S82_03465 [Bacteroidales bacterium]|nr:hypothetical protein [Bacteroidales bacterium]